MKKILLPAFMLLSALMMAQSKMNFDLAKILKEQSGSSALISVFVKGNPDLVKQLCVSNGGTFQYSAGNISRVLIPISSLKAFSEQSGIQRMEAYTPHIKPLNDTMLIQTNTIQVHNGTSPLPQGYDGNGIVVGIIDTGIDFTHPDFKDSTGKSRIAYLWDQAQPAAANTPMPYNYGQEWSGVQIDSGLASAHNDLTYLGHGTHVAGIAVGNGLATGTYKGVAAKADIIVVALDFSSTSPALVSDAASYIYAKAQAMGKPCVINASVGDYYGSHDGQDLQSQLISNMINSQNGQAFVAAAGNAGTVPYHLSYTVTADTNFTYLANSGSSPYIQIWADTADFNNVEFSIGADQMSPYSFRGKLPFSTIASHLGVLQEDTLFNNGNRIGRILSYGDIINGTYSMEYQITPDSVSYNWRLIMTGSGKFDAWSFDLYNGALPSASQMPDSIYYKQPDTDKTTVSGFLCLDNVIGVGNYTNRHSYIDYNGNPCINTSTIAGARHVSSSVGPTRDGRIKPDICAPGDNTVAAVVLSLVPGIVASYPDALALGGFHVRDGGTSHSSPCVAGIAALYLQKYPSATAMDVKNAIISCPKTDSFTGSSLPDNYWGYGKVDAFAALTCSLTGITEQLKPTGFSVYPNPASTGNIINTDFPAFNVSEKTEIRICNSIGQTVKIAEIKASSTSFINDLKPGIYFCRLFINGRAIASEKLIIL
jgi:subtilisin family serine protease